MTADASILIVSGEDRIRYNAGRALTGTGHQVRLTATVAEALVVLDECPIACAVVDAVLQDPYGMDLLRAIRQHHPEVPIIMVQGSPDVRAVMAARERGATEYLVEPLWPSALIAAVGRALRGPEPSLPAARSAPSTGLRSPSGGSDSARRFRELASEALDALVTAMEAKDPHLAGHSIRVAELAASIASQMGRVDWEVEEVRLAGRLHDIGMIAISDEILTRPGKLTPAEYTAIKRHPVLGHQLLVAYPTMARVASYVRGHHERWDGKGYPDGLSGESIPWGARIVAAAEIFDALTTSRSYRSAESVAEALERMHHTCADAVDPAVMGALQAVVTRRRTLEFIRDDENRDIESTLFGGLVGADEHFEHAVS